MVCFPTMRAMNECKCTYAYDLVGCWGWILGLVSDMRVRKLNEKMRKRSMSVGCCAVHSTW